MFLDIVLSKPLCIKRLKAFFARRKSSERVGGERYPLKHNHRNIILI